MEQIVSVDDGIQIIRTGSIVIMDKGHVFKVHDDQEHIITLLSNAGYERNEYIYLHPWWQIDEGDMVAIPVDRVAGIREIRDTKVVS